VDVQVLLADVALMVSELQPLRAITQMAAPIQPPQVPVASHAVPHKLAAALEDKLQHQEHALKVALHTRLLRMLLAVPHPKQQDTILLALEEAEHGLR
tara:strand:+ start:7932 stop:8225 length:294 start_codon:yes stop_codon:yes gene_type:complete